MSHGVCAVFAIVSLYVCISYGEIVLMCIVSTSAIPMREFSQFILFPELQPAETNWLDLLGAGLVTVAILILPCNELIKEYKERHQEYKSLEDNINDNYETYVDEEAELLPAKLTEVMK